MRIGYLFLIYVVVGLLVAGGVIGDEASYFSGLNNLEDIINMVLAVLLWPLVLLDVNINIGDGSPSGDGGPSSGGADTPPAQDASGADSSGAGPNGGAGQQ